MFDRIAGRYDVMNSLMSAGLHHRWRRLAADIAQVDRGNVALDACCGTGDFAIELKRRVGPSGRVVGLDFSEAMLEQARAKSRRVGISVEYIQGNALELPFEDRTFDVVTVGFGVRNLVDLRAGLAELARVLRLGGRLVVLEITTPNRAPLSWFYAVWFDRLVPLLGTLAGHRDAYAYLPSSVRGFPPAPELAGLMEEVGLEDVSYRLLAGGIVAIHCGTIPYPPAKPTERA